MQGRYRGDTAEIQGRYRGDTRARRDEEEAGVAALVVEVVDETLPG